MHVTHLHHMKGSSKRLSSITRLTQPLRSKEMRQEKFPVGRTYSLKKVKTSAVLLLRKTEGKLFELSYPWAPLLSASRLLPSLPWCLNQHPFDSDFGWLVFYLFHCGGREKQRSLNDAKASTISYISPCDYFIEIHHWVSSIVLDNFCY